MVKIVKISELDLASLRMLRDESTKEGYKFIERLWDDWACGANRFTGPGEALFLALVDGRVVGVCGLNLDPYASEPHTGRVRRFYVLPAHRRSGIGRAMLQVVIAHARNHFKQLHVRTEEADKFYVAQGFLRTTSDSEATHVLAL
jgi:GNAT superfamily N-acetyltransferase